MLDGLGVIAGAFGVLRVELIQGQRFHCKTVLILSHSTNTLYGDLPGAVLERTILSRSCWLPPSLSPQPLGRLSPRRRARKAAS